jgi:hypothetical protein
VISPQDGHIRCDAYPATCGFNRRILWSSRIVDNTMNRPNEMLVAFMTATILGERHTNQKLGYSLAEKPKVGKLQMNWLRSET